MGEQVLSLQEMELDTENVIGDPFEANGVSSVSVKCGEVALIGKSSLSAWC